MIFEISVETRALADRLLEVPHGGTVTLGALSAVIGRDITACRHLVYSAFNLVRRENGAAFGVVRNIGYQRLTLEQVPAVGSVARRHIGRTAKKAKKSISAALASANGVPNDVMLRSNSELSALGLISHLSRDRNVKPTTEMENAPLPVAKAAAAFLEHIGAVKKP